MRFNIKDTYCNPIVLPDYPVFDAIHFTLEANDVWGRGDKKLLDEMAIAREFGAPEDESPFFENVAPGYGKETANDVRTTADPSVYCFDGTYYLYSSGGQVYSSDDLVNWEVHYDDSWMKISEPMAPTVEEWNGKYYAMANSVPLQVSDNPIGPWSTVGDWILPDGREFVCGDPMLFRDDDNKMYLYFGMGGHIIGAQLDEAQPNQLVTEPKVLISFNKENYWERWGSCNENWGIGFVEGSWMLKHNNRYYLVYSSAGTEFYAYAMACYTSDSPLGHFLPQAKNPVSRNRSGLLKGGGHGSFVKGPDDTLWIFYTVFAGIDHAMERRIGMDPAGFDEEGNLFALTGCEVPQFKPGILQRPEKGNATELVTLTQLKGTKVSSCAPGRNSMYALDESLSTWWQPAAEDPEPVFAVALQGAYYISALRIMWKDIGMDLQAGVLPGAYRYVVEYTQDVFHEDWKMLVDASENETDLTVDYRTFDSVRAQAVRIRIVGAPEGITPGLMNFTVFGESIHKTHCQSVQ